MNVDKNELLFWRVFNSIVIRNHIFKVMKSMKIEFKSMNQCHIKNRIPLNRVRSLGWYLKRNEIELLKDRLLHTNCSGSDDEGYLLVKESCIKRLMKFNDLKLIKLVYEKCKSQMDEYDLIFFSATNYNYIALEYFIKQNPTLLDERPDSLKYAIVYGNLSVLKYLYETRVDGRSKIVSILKEKLRKKNIGHTNENLNKQEIIEYLIEIDIFKNEMEPFICSITYSELNDLFGNYLLNLNLVYDYISNIDNCILLYRSTYTKERDNRMNLFYNKYINYQNLIGNDNATSNDYNYHNRGGHKILKNLRLKPNEKEFKFENYPNIKEYIYSNIIHDSSSFEEIESQIEPNRSTFEISYLKKLIFDFFKKNNKNKYMIIKKAFKNILYY